MKERQEFEFRPLDWGNLLHSALELFSKKVQKTGKLWTMLEEEERDELLEASVDETITDYGNTILYSSARNEYLITRLKQMMARTIWALTKQMERGAFRPSGYEVNFYGGKIDRVDTCEQDDKIYVKIIDYKTGTQSFDLAALYHGLQMQLVVYMDAAMTVEEKRHPDQHVVPAGIFYYKIKDPIVSREEDMERLEEAILKELRLDGIVNSDDAVLRLIDEEMKPGTSSSVIPRGQEEGRDADHGIPGLCQKKDLLLSESIRRRKLLCCVVGSQPEKLMQLRMNLAAGRRVIIVSFGIFADLNRDFRDIFTGDFRSCLRKKYWNVCGRRNRRWVYSGQKNSGKSLTCVEKISLYLQRQVPARQQCS